MSVAFAEFMREASDAGGLQTDDVLQAFLPLAQQVAGWHEQGLVAPPLHSDALQVEAGVLRMRQAAGMPSLHSNRPLDSFQRKPISGLQVVGRGRVTSDDEAGVSYECLDVADAGTELTHPVYVVGYGAWEQALGHHDALTDIFSLGLVLAALALHLDFDERDDVERFVMKRNDLFALNPRAHPVIVAAILEMTELNRRRRAPDLRGVVHRLDTWREQPADIDIERLPDFARAPAAGRRALVKAHLRDRLFEISRRNRLLYFRPTQASVNLTVASVPLVLHLNSIRREQLFVWQGDIVAQLSAGSAVNLGKHLRFEDQPYLAGALDRVIADARRDRAEFGFAQLRLVLAFLQWHNLRETPQERIVSPLLLLPVELTRKKGVRDQYVLTPTGSEAEVNPVLRHHLRRLYDLDLPAAIDLSKATIELFHANLQSQIRASEPAVTLRLADEPQIELMHEKARQRLAQFNRRRPHRVFAAAGRTAREYSYELDDYRPLGLQLFRDKVTPTPLPQRAAAGGASAPRTPNMVTHAVGNETERQTFALRDQREGNPYLWDFDICSLTLCNFNYRKMSLVRDYNALIEEETSGDVFDQVFSVEPRKVDSEEPASLQPADEWPVVSSDATQRSAVALARTGCSYIIQGPPGTGKSQTITNLIADYVARGKRVLFVCEKRAALDVVFHRLRQRGLDELCCLIHDSQTDKKEFVHNLRQTYENWLAQPDGADDALAQRESLLKRIQQDVEQLKRFDSLMMSAPDHVGCSVRELIHSLATLREREPRLNALDLERLPTFAAWRRHADLAYRLSATLEDVCGVDALARHPFKSLSAHLIGAERPLQTLYELTDQAETALDAIAAALETSGVSTEHYDTIGKIEQLVNFIDGLAPLAERGQLALLDEHSKLSQELAQAADAVARAQMTLDAARKKTLYWRDKLEPAECEAAFAHAMAKERSIFRFLSGSWRLLRRTIEARYDFSRHAVRIPLSQVLKDLNEEHVAARSFELSRANGAERFLVAPDLLAMSVKTLIEQAQSSESLAALRASLLEGSGAKELVRTVTALAPKMRELLDVLPKFLIESRGLPLSELGGLIRDLREEADALPELLPLLAELVGTDESFLLALRYFALPPDALAAASARKSLELVYRTERWLPRFDARLIEHYAERIAQAEQQWLESNAAAVRSVMRRNFREHVQLTTTSVTQLTDEQRLFKKSYSAGRRELEREFSKTMRYKSIRDLAAGDSGKVIRHLKPIWLMSPLSVSDTLPLEMDLFDTVIFDEASQIPVEEAVPALYRGPQIIVVGDEMQLPPTNFFTTARADDSSEVEIDEDGERVAISLDADSLLTQCAKNLPATLLAWHYRSRSESLISFSNAAFYSGNLFTIPDRALPEKEQSALRVHAAGDAAKHISALLARPLSFHLMEASPYADRRNPGEAAYIAELLRELLRSETRLSMGVVAFSEAQQAAIESALDELANSDQDFARQLEEAFVREESDQFCGLFVKNLENVQGDERDIIILSICYGPDAAGKMLMNFGPINQRGGEKRLNVIFSRARHHMAIISSIRHHAITNDYNDGAAALKRFLQYAESASMGDLQSSRITLESLNPLARKTVAPGQPHDQVTDQIAARLRARGRLVDTHVGQSRFRCDLAVRSEDGRNYRLGVIVDTEEQYANRNVPERYVTRPAILRSFGWEVLLVLTRDWYHDPEGVLARIDRRLRGEADELEPATLELSTDSQRESASKTMSSEAQAVSMPEDSPVSIAKVRRLEFVEGRSSKFWEISRVDTILTIRYGRIGTHGQILTKGLSTPQLAERELEKLLAEKLRKGYCEVAAGA